MYFCLTKIKYSVWGGAETKPNPGKGKKNLFDKGDVLEEILTHF